MIDTNKTKPYESYVPADKKLDPAWIESLTAREGRKIYSGDELKYISMPCGGIGAGQIEITPNGTLGSWWIFNEDQPPNRGKGDWDGYCYLHPLPIEKRVEHGFAIRIQSAGQPAQVLELSGKDFDAMQFIGEYPIATLNYLKTGAKLPVNIQSEVFSPFIPLNVRDSANPATILKFSVTNTASQTLDITLGAWLENYTFPEKEERRISQVARNSDATSVQFKLDSQASGEERAQFGDLALSVLDGQAHAAAYWPNPGAFIKAFQAGKPGGDEKHTGAAGETGVGSVCSHFTLAPGQTRQVTFLVTWFFPNLSIRLDGIKFQKVGRVYSNWYKNSVDAARYIAANEQRLYRDTRLFRDTYFDTTLPYWLANRITMPVSTLAADNTSIFENGRMYSYEGVGFCFGTCGHVLNFATAIAKLFPELERSMRLQQDLDENWGYDPASGRINFRGHDAADPVNPHAYASDAQSGYVLKIYREHLMSPDRAFLDSVWPKVKRIIGYQIFLDGLARGVEPNGVLKGVQTAWDPQYYGPNPYNQSLYLAALRAAEEMARIEGETSLADRYHALFVSGQNFMNHRMWNGDYYVSLYPSGFKSMDLLARCIVTPAEEQANAKSFIDAFNQGEPNYFVSTECDAQQLFGQNWAHQVDLGYLLPPENCRKAASSVFLYNWTPDISHVYKLYPPKNRTLAAPGEGALVNGSWPREPRRDFENIHDKEDIWTGLEYQAAADMINEGLVREGLIVIRAIHDRYDARKRNPWDEIDGSDHYARALHCWNILLAISGATHDGPGGKIGFAPRLKPENFKSFFSAAQGWGSFMQTITGGLQTATINLAWGQLRVNEISLSQASKSPTRAVAKLNGVVIETQMSVSNGRAIIRLAKEQTIGAGGSLRIELTQ